MYTYTYTGFATYTHPNDARYHEVVASVVQTNPAPVATIDR